MDKNFFSYNILYPSQSYLKDTFCEHDIPFTGENMVSLNGCDIHRI